MRYDVGRFRRPMRRSTEGQLMSLISLGDGSTLSLDFTTGVLDPRLTFTRASTGTFINASGNVATASNNVARFDHDPTTGAPRGLLIEGTATNLVTQSNGSTSVWGTGGNRTPTNNTTDLVSPDGTNNATKLVCGSAGAYASFATSISGLTGGATYTISYWIRGPVGHSPRLYAQNGTIGDVTATATTGTYNNTGWTRLTQTYTLPAATTQCLVYFLSANIGTTGDTFYVYGFQMETGSGASSYIPTGASTVQRLADDCGMTGTNFSSWWPNPTAEFTVLWTGDITQIPPASAQFIWLSRASGTSKARAYVTTGSVIRANSSVFDFTASPATTATANTVFKSAMAVKSGDSAMYVNSGSVIGSQTDASTGTTTNHDSLYFNPNADNFMHIRVFKFWPTRLSNATLQGLVS